MRHQCRSVFQAMLLAVVWLLLVDNAASARDEAVLLSSTAPGYAPGMVVSGDERLAVPEGATAILLFQTGEMLQLRGPFVGPLRSAEARNGNTGSVAGLVEALRFQGIDAAVVGGTRSLAAVPRRRGLDTDLVVDPQRSATYCLGKTTSVWIGRPDEGGDRISLRRRGTAREITWPADAARVEWPVDVLIEDGDRFEINAAGRAAPATVTFRILDDRSPSDPARVAQAALMGCHDQVSDALRDLGRAISPRELWLATDRGRQPTYRPGEPMRMIIQSNGDGFLYCVHQYADGTVVPFFPAGAVGGARLRGHEPLSIPGQRGVSEVTAGPRGQGWVICYLADRDIAPELPRALLSDAARYLPENVASRLDAVFASIRGTRVLKASLPIQVE